MFYRKSFSLHKITSFCFSNVRFQDFKSPNIIRNFCIIAHIDHGKSTLADRFLEITNTIIPGHTQYLDKLKVEKDRGITVKAQSCTMFYKHNNIQYMLNLIDTPGHVDFTYEVSRSMRSCEAAVLLVDATQGVQAQTLSNYDLAMASNLKIIPVLNKIDMPGANLDGAIEEMKNCFGFREEEIQKISAKTGSGVEPLLISIIENVPPPKVNNEKNFKGFLIDSWFVKDRGVYLLMQLKDGQVAKGDKIVSCHFKKKYDVFEVGIMNPETKLQKNLSAGQVGYLLANMKTVQESRIGDTFFIENKEVSPLPGFKPAKPMVYAGIYPEDLNDYIDLEKSIYKLALTDPSVSIVRESSAALGSGFRCGFLGILHMDVFKQRLDDEYGISTIVTSPSVQYRCKLKDGKEADIENALTAPEAEFVNYYEEPIADVKIICPKDSLSNIIKLCEDRRGTNSNISNLDENKMLVRYEIPLAEIITDFFDKVKSLSRGYATLDYDFKCYRKSRIKKLTILIMGETLDALSFMVHEESAFEFGKKLCKKLKEKIDRQLFTVAIQAKLGSKIIAREDIQCMRKNVTAKCYGGDYSRKKKLLDRQKEGKKNMRRIGNVEIKKDLFIDILKN